jgi:hypothetical protein
VRLTEQQMAMLEEVREFGEVTYGPDEWKQIVALHSAGLVTYRRLMVHRPRTGRYEERFIVKKEETLNG